MVIIHLYLVVGGFHCFYRHIHTFVLLTILPGGIFIKNRIFWWISLSLTYLGAAASLFFALPVVITSYVIKNLYSLNKNVFLFPDACELTLDPNTAHKNLLLSERNTKVTWVQEQQQYPHHPERFDQCQQVMCQQGLNGRYYFELEVLEPFNIGLTYRTIGRKGDGNDCKLGHNNKSWSLICSDDGCYVLHGDDKVSVASHCSRSTRVGAYLDWPAGTLSFYRVFSDSWIRLHTFKTTFSEPLYPAVELHPHSFVLFFQPT